MEEKRYLTLGNKIGYGMGEVSGNLFNALVSNFYMIFLTNTVGLNPGIIGTLMMVSKVFDGVTDVFFGNLIDKTRTKMGRARPWMLFSQIGVSLCLVLLFSIPSGADDWMKYAWFFVFYVALNAIFYTMNNVALSALTALITKNKDERVQTGVFRFVFVMLTQLAVSTTGVTLSNTLGWQAVAVIFSVIGLAVNTISVFSFHELPTEVLLEQDSSDIDAEEQKKDDLSIWRSLELLVKNKFYIIMLIMNILTYLVAGAMGAAIYFFTYNMGNENLYSFFMIAMMVPMLVGLALTPMVVKRFGMTIRRRPLPVAGFGWFRDIFGEYVTKDMGRLDTFSYLDEIRSGKTSRFYDDVPTLVPFLVRGSKTAVIVAPGGGFCNLSRKREGYDMARFLNENGISAFVLEYRLNPYKAPVCYLDMQRAIRYVRHHAVEYGISSKQIGAMGFSAGGYVTGASYILLGNAPVEYKGYKPDEVDEEDGRADFLGMIFADRRQCVSGGCRKWLV